MNDINVGDEVITAKGCRFKGAGGILKVVKVGMKWREYDAATCEKADGVKRTYLMKNLIKVTES